MRQVAVRRGCLAQWRGGQSEGNSRQRGQLQAEGAAPGRRGSSGQGAAPGTGVALGRGQLQAEG